MVANGSHVVTSPQAGEIVQPEVPPLHACSSDGSHVDVAKPPTVPVHGLPLPGVTEGADPEPNAPPPLEEPPPLLKELPLDELVPVEASEPELPGRVVMIDEVDPELAPPEH